MRIINTVGEMQRFSDALHRQGKTVAVVPTMGFLHEGHLSLMRLGKQKSDVLVVTIFVNPTQFGPGEDFEDYPRDWERDRQLVESVGADCIFAPEAAEMYPEGYQSAVTVRHITQNLCGLSRPTHFEGVATVVAKLFNCTKPDCAIFGQKDFQQLMVIRRMVRDLDFDIEIVGAPIVREEDGIAMSSRNTYLSEEERRSARSLSRALSEVKALCAGGERDAGTLVRHAAGIIGAEKLGRIDYVKICDVDTMQDTGRITGAAAMALAVHFSRARLIDNVLLGE